MRHDHFARLLRRSCSRSLSSISRSCTLQSRLVAHAATSRTAIVDVEGTTTTYAGLLQGASSIAQRLRTGTPEFEPGGRVAFLAPPGADYVCILLGIWQAGGVAVPLCVTHPEGELLYAVEESEACVVIASTAPFFERIQFISAGRCCFQAEGLPLAAAGPGSFDPIASHDEGLVDEAALIVFTSGTTGRPKGVVLTHANLKAQCASLVDAWGWRSSDCILHVLPLHHLHGLVNKLLCALWAGASVAFSPPSPREVWRRLGRAKQDGLTLFMAVPTNYALLLREVETCGGAETELIANGLEGARSLRLMVSGSMALPTPLLERWRRLTGHTLLERYGMTEIGMALSHPLSVRDRVPGSVGRPLPSVEVRIRDPESGDVVQAGCEGSGELLVRGPAVFREYYNRPDETRQAFTEGGWFLTGDHASVDAAGRFRILGRSSVDIIKSAGYKISALEVERVLLAHPFVDEVAVVGVDDDAFGQCVAAVVVPSAAAVADNSCEDSSPSRCDGNVQGGSESCGGGGEEASSRLLAALQEGCGRHLAMYKAPTLVRVVAEIPKNAMGKVNKKELARLFAG